MHTWHLAPALYALASVLIWRSTWWRPVASGSAVWRFDKTKLDPCVIFWCLQRVDSNFVLQTWRLGDPLAGCRPRAVRRRCHQTLPCGSGSVEDGRARQQIRVVAEAGIPG